jgi:hypothetical protein
MAIFTTYAEVLTPDHVQSRAYNSGIKKNPPGLLLQDILERTGGVYELKLELPDEFREKIRRVAELTSDEKLLHVANLSGMTISLEHLRHLDPRATRIVSGYRLNYTREESERLGLQHEGPFDPKNTIHLKP